VAEGSRSTSLVEYDAPEEVGKFVDAGLDGARTEGTPVK
jgi:hypothetical protein